MWQYTLSLGAALEDGLKTLTTTVTYHCRRTTEQPFIVCMAVFAEDIIAASSGVYHGTLHTTV